MGSECCDWRLDHSTYLQCSWSWRYTVMIPSKILVYHNPSGGTRTETYKSTRRRKKSHGELFKNGYRVKPGHNVPEKEEQRTLRSSLVSCYRVGSYWGKVQLSFFFRTVVCYTVSGASITVSSEKDVLFYFLTLKKAAVFHLLCRKNYFTNLHTAMCSCLPSKGVHCPPRIK